ncbi:class I tRNA ligase family protein, partial [Patescibacteria group bacterium]|nr:class I tRNA ligase family protein [Patescibacteria group bacterium]
MNEEKKGKFYVTTSIAYVNAAPHIGFAMEALQADVLARYKRNQGYDVFSLTGTDEHGVKLYQVARDAGKEPQALADENAEKFRGLKDLLSLSYDHFVRTTDDNHKKGAQKLWKAIEASGDLYKDKYTGYYCVGCEAFVTEKDLEDGKCPIHKKEPNHLEEENYYFRLSKYQDQLAKLIESDELRVVPESRKNEILSLIKGGLRDVSFS